MVRDILKKAEFHKMTQRALDDLVENFLLFDDWEGRYQYLIELGEKLPPMESAFKTEANEVKGCVSRVWLDARKDSDGRYHFSADSDAKITKGLVALVIMAHDDLTADEIAQTDLTKAFERIGLDQHLSPNRRNGFMAMLARVKSLR